MFSFASDSFGRKKQRYYGTSFFFVQIGLNLDFGMREAMTKLQKKLS